MAYREAINGLIEYGIGSFQGNNSGNAPTLMMLGGFKFSLNTAVFQELNRNTSYSWPAQERVGNWDALQFTGPGVDRIRLPGVIYPQFRGGLGQVENLRSLASQGRPLRLIGADGSILGLWVIEGVEEFQAVFEADGTFKRQDFTVSIRKYGDGADV